MSIIDKAKEMLSHNADKAKGAVDKAGNMVDDKTGGKYKDHINQAQDKAKGYIDGQNQQGQSQQGQGPQGQQPQDGSQP